MVSTLDNLAGVVSDFSDDEILGGTWDLLLFEQVSSTMDISRELLSAAGACLDRSQHFTSNDAAPFASVRIQSSGKRFGFAAESGSAPYHVIVLALSQTKGRGREGRTWVSSTGVGIYMTIGLTLPSNCDFQGLSLGVGIGVARAAEAFGVEAKLKWPNDVVVDKNGWRKLAGILVESIHGADSLIRLNIGIGVNLSRPATGSVVSSASLAEHATRACSYDDAAETVLREIMFAVSQCLRAGFSSLKDDWNERSCISGAVVQWTQPRAGQQLTAGQEPPAQAEFRTARAITVVSDGGLLIEDVETGAQKIAYSGEISLKGVYADT